MQDYNDQAPLAPHWIGCPQRQYCCRWTGRAFVDRTLVWITAISQLPVSTNLGILYKVSKKGTGCLIYLCIDKYFFIVQGDWASNHASLVSWSIRIYAVITYFPASLTITIFLFENHVAQTRLKRDCSKTKSFRITASTTELSFWIFRRFNFYKELYQCFSETRIRLPLNTNAAYKRRTALASDFWLRFKSPWKPCREFPSKTRKLAANLPKFS